MDEEQRSAYAAFLAMRRSELMERIASAAARAGREASDVTLLAVSKTVGNEELALAYDAGYRVFGENRPQELKRKTAFAHESPGLVDARFDMIGNLQKNKINQVLGVAKLVHSVSSVHLGEALARRSDARGLTTHCLLEVNVSGEPSKSGVSPDEVPATAELLMGLSGIALEGLMTMAPAHDAQGARASFEGLRELRDDLRERTGAPLPHLSCGMSDDFEIAVEEGSTLVRLGRIVFDPSYAST